MGYSILRKKRMKRAYRRFQRGAKKTFNVIGFVASLIVCSTTAFAMVKENAPQLFSENRLTQIIDENKGYVQTKLPNSDSDAFYVSVIGSDQNINSDIDNIFTLNHWFINSHLWCGFKINPV